MANKEAKLEELVSTKQKELENYESLLRREAESLAEREQLVEEREEIV